MVKDDFENVNINKPLGLEREKKLEIKIGYINRYYMKHGFSRVQDLMKKHSWIGREWIDSCQVWFERCRDCEAIRTWRGNDTIYIDKDGNVTVLECKEHFTKNFIKRCLQGAKQR